MTTTTVCAGSAPHRAERRSQAARHCPPRVARYWLTWLTPIRPGRLDRREPGPSRCSWPAPAAQRRRTRWPRLPWIGVRRRLEVGPAGQFAPAASRTCGSIAPSHCPKGPETRSSCGTGRVRTRMLEGADGTHPANLLRTPLIRGGPQVKQHVDDVRARGNGASPRARRRAHISACE